MYALMELVEARITKQMKDKVGSILYDAWTKCGLHYVAVYGAYILKDTLEMNLLAVSPMPAIEDTDGDEEATLGSYFLQCRSLEELLG